MRQRVRCAKQPNLNREALLRLLTLMVDNSKIYNGEQHLVTQSAEELRRLAHDFM